MSLQSLINLRTKHRVAPNAVWVIVGDAPKWLDDSPGVVVVKPGSKSLDFRALVGLNIDVIEIGNHPQTLARVMDAVDQENPKTKSIACSLGIIGLSEDHERCLEKARSLLCT